MGYKKGKGLGKHEQGRVEIVEASKHRGRRGLGLLIPGLEAADDKDWDFETEEVRSEFCSKAIFLELNFSSAG